MVGFAILFVFGLSTVSASPAVGPKIVGGENAAQGEFPFIVSLQSDGYHICGGSLISNRWVLTAGHCIEDDESFDGSTLEVFYGDISLKNANPKSKVKIIKQILHPNFTDEESKTVLIRNDLALLKLEHPLNFSANVQTIQLPRQDEAVPVNHSATLIGWGYTESVWTDPNLLQKVNLTIFDFPYCDHYNAALNFSNDQNICAGNNNNTKGQCSGDSGGPLFINGVQWGIVSWSIKPCISAPGVFTRTSVFVDWINSVIASN